MPVLGVGERASEADGVRPEARIRGHKLAEPGARRIRSVTTLSGQSSATREDLMLTVAGAAGAALAIALACPMCAQRTGSAELPLLVLALMAAPFLVTALVVVAARSMDS